MNTFWLRTASINQLKARVSSKVQNKVFLLTNDEDPGRVLRDTLWKRVSNEIWGDK